MAEEKKGKVWQCHEGFQKKFVMSNVDFLVGGSAMGVGKAQPLDSLVCTPFGFRRMGDLKVGDTITSANGSFQKIIQVHERGELDIVKIKFKDGRSTLCAKDHLWKVRKSGHWTHRFRKEHNYDAHWEIMTTESIIKHLDSKSQYTLYIPHCGDIAFTKSGHKRDIHPYLLGCLLGDGCITATQWSASLCAYDYEMIEKIISLGYDIRNTPSSPDDYVIHDKNLTNALKREKLWGHKADTKFIPKKYLLGSIVDRTELLQGLFDTDGTIDKRGYIEFDTISEQLAKDVAFLVRSFGGLCSISEKQGSYKNKEGEKIICQKVYRLYIRLKDSKRFFHLSRKKERCKDNIRIGNGSCESAIVGYELLGKTEMRCITVSCPDSLYLTDDFVVTHNSMGALLMAAQHTSDPNFRMVYLRRNIGDLRSGGGGLDEATKLYGNIGTIKISENPRLTFPSGAFIDFTHMSDQREDNVLERVKGWQYSCIYVDEATGFSWSTIRLLMSRNRSQAKWSGKMRLTCNPKRNHWLRKWVDWWVDEQGYPIPERDGVVRYFYVNGRDIDDVIFGDTPKAVYDQCRSSIDAILKVQGDDYTYKDLIKSTTFLSGKLAENVSLMQDNAGYLGSVAAMGEKQRQANLMGCWNVDVEEDLDTPISTGAARHIIMNEPQRNGARWITADIADIGTDNTFILVWDGYHIIDYKILPVATTNQNVDWIKHMARKYDIPDNHIIFDSRRAVYLRERIPEGIGFDSSYAPRGLYKRDFMLLKDECYMRLVEAVNTGRISMDEKVANAVYTHQNISSEITILDEFVEECGVVQFNISPSGKKRLLTKKEMNSQLGKNRSMDVLDPCAMRFYPDLYSEYGQELANGAVNDEEYADGVEMVNIYDDSTWA